MDNQKLSKNNQSGLKELFKQFLQLKSFSGFAGGGVGIFLLIYANPDQWSRVINLFYLWLAITFLWFIYLIYIYGSELINRVLISVSKFFQKIIPYSLITIGYLLILIPPTLQKAIGLIFIFIPILFIKDDINNLVLNLYRKKNRKKISRNIKNNNTFSINDWVATETQDEQGASHRPINLDSKRIRELSFVVKPQAGSYWRAGFKLCSLEGNILPLRTDNSLLFHIYSNIDFNQNQLGVIYYVNGNTVKNINISTKRDKIKITVSLYKDYGNIKINNETIKKVEINEEWLNKIFLVAWGDGNPYRIDFEDIKYQLK